MSKTAGAQTTEAQTTTEAQKGFKWYIVKTKTNCEFRAREAIQRLAKDHHLSNKIQDILIPEKEVVEVIKGKKMTRSRKFYPGYIFIQMQLTNQLWHLIRHATSVVNFVGKQGQPTEVPAEQILAITTQVEEDATHPDAKVAFTVGEYVQVIDGPFKSFNGVVEAVNQEKARLKVSVSIFGRPTPVELDFSQVYRAD